MYSWEPHLSTMTCMYITIVHILFLERHQIMSNDESHVIGELLSLHNALWDRQDRIQYFGESYDVYHADHKGFSRTLVPGKYGKNIMYITHNLNESSYGTLEIQRAAKAGKTTRITWIINPSSDSLKLIGVIKTTPTYSTIERYDSFGTHTLYHTDPKFQPVKSAH